MYTDFLGELSRGHSTKTGLKIAYFGSTNEATVTETPEDPNTSVLILDVRLAVSCNF